MAACSRAGDTPLRWKPGGGQPQLHVRQWYQAKPGRDADAAPEVLGSRTAFRQRLVNDSDVARARQSRRAGCGGYTSELWGFQAAATWASRPLVDAGRWRSHPDRHQRSIQIGVAWLLQCAPLAEGEATPQLHEGRFARLRRVEGIVRPYGRLPPKFSRSATTPAYITWDRSDA